MENKTVNIFWTGGWDSTFRVLQLLIEDKKKVQPHFVVRRQKSVGYEIQAMINIRKKLFRVYPYTNELLLPIKFTDEKDINEYEKVSNAIKELRKTQELARQYDFCSRYCKQNEIHDMELSLTFGGSVRKIIDPYLNEYELREDLLKSNDEKLVLDVFKYFRFPLINTSKVDMKLIAKKAGWDYFLDMTWFCAIPRNGKPCGFCGPCTYVVEEGLSKRLPFFRRLISILHMPFRRFYRENIKFKDA